MTYSACDFADDVFDVVVRNRLISEAEANDPDLEDNSQLQSELVQGAIIALLDLRQVAQNLVTAVDAQAEQGAAIDPGVASCLSALKTALAAATPSGTICSS